MSDRLGFDGIADGRRRGVGIDVIHLCRGYAGIRKGQLHRIGHFQAIFTGDDHVIGLAGGGVAGNFGIDSRLAFLGMRSRFQDERPSAFSHDKTVPQSIEGPRGLLRVIVEFGREGAQGTKSGEDERGNAGVGSYSDYDIGPALADRVERLSERVGAGGASRRDG